MKKSEIRKGTRIVMSMDNGRKEHGVVSSDNQCGPFYYVDLDNGRMALALSEELEPEDRSDS